MYYLSNNLKVKKIYYDGHEDEPGFMEGYNYALAEAELEDAKKHMYGNPTYDEWHELYKKQFAELEEKYLPVEGEADIVYGEIIRAISRIIYRFTNDGDVFPIGYGIETVYPSVYYLFCKNVIEEEEIVDLIEDWTPVKYNKFILNLIKWTIDHKDDEEYQVPNQENSIRHIDEFLKYY